MEQSRDSLATENSDEEPLDGDASEHVENMLRQCLQPDERDGGGSDNEDDEDELSSDSDWGQGALMASDAHEGDGASLVKDTTPDSDIEDVEEEAALRLQVISLNRGLREFDAWASACLDSAQARVATAAQQVPRRSPSATQPESIDVLKKRCTEALVQLRTLLGELRVLTVNQQALLCASTQQLLRVSHMQAETALRHHQQTRRRHKQLRIVRKETARLCRELDARDNAPRTASPHSQRETASPTPSPTSTLAAPLEPPLYGATAPRALLTHVVSRHAEAACAAKAATAITATKAQSRPGSSRPRTPLDSRLDASGLRPGSAACTPSAVVSGHMPQEMTKLIACACERAALGGGQMVAEAAQRPPASKGHRMSPRASAQAARQGAPPRSGLASMGHRLDSAERAVLSQPAVQAALAEALWHTLSEQQLADANGDRS